MYQKRMIKCPNCGTFNTDRDQCSECNSPLNERKKKHETRKEKVKSELIEQVIYEKENPNLPERLKRHKYAVVRAFGWILFSVIWVVSAIVSAFVWFVTMVAAG
ncbi:MAG: hypothetical protein CMB99_05075 [Flavobacteriaceae bacterium]|nr:hypothetical protein [Flavobacteriaceae bacterium]|tara:strand:+ start:86056 stop:86367 length:312 start_codon:yes stop_codon:yes gene_type:complete